MTARLLPRAALRPATCLTLAVFAALGACRPPASDKYVERIELSSSERGPQVLPTSPSVEGALWASSAARRIVFGRPGETPLIALECSGTGADATLAITRFAPTERDAQGMMALIGNGQVARLKIDAWNNGRAWLWQGRYVPIDPRLDALAGARALEVTIPGAGTLKLPASPMPGQLIEQCRAQAAPRGITAPAPVEPAPPA